MPKKLKKEKPEKKPGLHEELQGFSIDINEFGEIKTSMPLDKLNAFLNKHVEDKKLKDRDDLEGSSK